MHLPTILLSTSLHFLPIASIALTKPPLNLLTPSTPNTTPNINLTVPTATCFRITDPPMVGLDPSNCDVVIGIICHQLGPAPEELVRDRWIWAELPGCALGYYLPARAWAADRGHCERTFEAVVGLCASDSRWNAGGVNVEVMPDFGGDGRAEREGRMRYAMAPERLTLP